MNTLPLFPELVPAPCQAEPAQVRSDLFSVNPSVARRSSRESAKTTGLSKPRRRASNSHPRSSQARTNGRNQTGGRTQASARFQKRDPAHRIENEGPHATYVDDHTHLDDHMYKAQALSAELLEQSRRRQAQKTGGAVAHPRQATLTSQFASHEMGVAICEHLLASLRTQSQQEQAAV